MAGLGLRLFAVTLLLLGNLTMPVVCVSATHTEVELPWNLCPYCGTPTPGMRREGISLEDALEPLAGLSFEDEEDQLEDVTPDIEGEPDLEMEGDEIPLGEDLEL